MKETWNAETLIQQAWSFQSASILMAAAELDLFTAVGDGATAADAAEKMGTSRRATEMLAILCAFAVVTGYLGVLLSQTNTYFKEDFGASNTAISWVLTGVRLGALLALAPGGPALPPTLPRPQLQSA